MQPIDHYGKGIYSVRDTGATPTGISRMVWETLRAAEPTLPAMLPRSVGAHPGDSLNLQWWFDDSAEHFAVQALDMQACASWELFHVPLNAEKVVGWKRTWALELGAVQDKGVFAHVMDAIKGQLAAPCPSEQHPSFIHLALAGAGCGDVRLVTSDGATLANVQAELEYWRGLAKESSKANARSRSSTQTAQVVKPLMDVESPPSGPEALEERNWTLRDLGEWAADNADRIVVLPRAISEAKKSPYEDHALVYRCLDLLANEYTQTKTGQCDRFAFKERADQMGLEYGGSVEPSVAGGTKSEQYFIRWRGRRRFLDQHLTHGNARNPRYCLRIYFTWDEDDKRVIVGWLPSHLATSGS